MKKITLNMDGREMTFSEQELTAIVKEHLSSKTTKKETTDNVVKKPTEGEWFEVNPQTIDQKLFEKKREDNWQEPTRQCILGAFTEMKKNPEKYGKSFKTMMPNKNWDIKSVAELKAKARILGDHNADWVEQALEWAQRIANGESWEDICNNPDTANWHRLVVEKRGHAVMVGGSVIAKDSRAVSDVYSFVYSEDDWLETVVPLVVSYK